VGGRGADHMLLLLIQKKFTERTSEIQMVRFLWCSMCESSGLEYIYLKRNSSKPHYELVEFGRLNAEVMLVVLLLLYY
jgi:hypothetical protein